MTIKLTKQEWKEIKKAIRRGESISELSRQYNISRNSIYVYANKRNWMKQESKLNKVWNAIKKIYWNST
jgi:Mor family transcriptional regulator